MNVSFQVNQSFCQILGASSSVLLHLAVTNLLKHLAPNLRIASTMNRAVGDDATAVKSDLRRCLKYTKIDQRFGIRLCYRPRIALLLPISFHQLKAFRGILPNCIKFDLIGELWVNVLHAPQLGATDHSPGGEEK